LTFGIFSSSIYKLHSQEPNKVLLFIRDGSMDLEYMLEKEAGVMKETLEAAGYKVEIATLSGEPISAGSVNLTPDLKISDVSVPQYAGFILPCMAVDDAQTQPPEEAVKMVKEAAAAGKPVAAQLGSIRTLAKAGLLKGKKYASVLEYEDPYFEGSIRSGTGIVRDGNIITSGVCPFMARENQIQDGTEALVSALIDAIKPGTD
jgi:putative intracellular protease/amidase